MRVTPVPGLPEVARGDDLVALICAAVADAGVPVADGDVFVVASKVVSKAEGRMIAATDRERAITDEAVRLVASREHPGGVTRIVETRHGFVMAAAGVDASNVPEGMVLLLPLDPDGSARALMLGLRERLGRRVGVVVSDTFGRPWREGQTDLAIGAAGVRVFADYRGETDVFGNELHVSVAATVDELASAANLVKGKLGGVPVAVVSGLDVVTEEPGPGVAALIREPGKDMFRRGSAEAFADGFAQGLAAGGGADAAN